GGDAFSALGPGAGDAERGSAASGDEQGVQLATGGGDLGDHASRASTAAAADGAVRVPGTCGHASRATVSAAGARWRTPVAEIERILALYRERYSGFNGRHFFATVRREHEVKLSYSCVKQILQGAGLMRKSRARGRHRRRRG